MGVPSGPFYVDDLLTFTTNTHRVDTGAGTDADSVPSYRVYEDETGTAILTGSMAKLDDTNTVGFYSEQLTLSAANGFEVGKSYAIYISATVNSVTATQSYNFKVIAATYPANVTQFGGTNGTFAAGRPEVNTTHAAGTAWGSGAITAASIAADAITDAKVASDVTIASVTGAVGSVTGAVGSVTGAVGSVAAGGIVAASFAADAITAAKVAADVGTEIGTAVWATTTRLLTAGTNIVLAKGVGVTGFNDLSAAQVNTEADTALADYDGPTNAELATALGTADDAVLAQVALVKAKTDNLPSDPADASVVAGLIAAVEAKVDTVDTVVDAIKVTNDKLDTALELDGAVYRYTTNSLEQAPTGGGAPDGSGFTAIPWNAAWDAEVQSEVTDALNAYDPPTRAELTSDTNSVLTAVGDTPTNAELTTALVNLDVAVSTRLATAGYTAPDNAGVTAIKAKTDSLTFTVAGQVDSNIQSVNDVTVTGNGQTGTEWGP